MLSVSSFTVAFPQNEPPVLSQAQADWAAVESRLRRQIADGTVEQKRDALFEIRNLRSAAASAIALPALKDSDEMVRATAAASVVFLPGPEAASALLPLLNDRDEFVRREAAYALAEAGDASATQPLIKMLRGEKVLEARNAAAIGLGGLGDASAVPALTDVLKTRPREEDDFLRRSAARSIGRIAQIISTGERKIVTPQNFLPEKFKDTRAGDDLTGRFPAFRAAVTVLTKVLRDNSEEADIRREAAFALGAIADRSSVAILESSAASTDPYLAEISREALLKIRGR